GRVSRPVSCGRFATLNRVLALTAFAGRKRALKAQKIAAGRPGAPWAGLVAFFAPWVDYPCPIAVLAAHFCQTFDRFLDAGRFPPGRDRRWKAPGAAMGTFSALG